MTQMMEHATATADVFPVKGVDYLQFLVGNAKQAAHYYSTAFGMTCVAYRGPEQGYRDHAEYVLVSGSARFLVTGAVHAGAPGADHVARHSDGISDIALDVPDVDAAYPHAVAAGARGVTEPHDLTDEHGTVRIAAIATYGDTDPLAGRPVPLRRPVPARLRGPRPDRRPAARDRRRPAAEALLPGRRPRGRQRRAGQDGRVGGVLPPGHGLHQHGRVRRRRHRHRLLGADVQGRRGRHPQGQVPAQRAGRVGQRKSQIDEYLEFYGGPGAQHIAVATNDILASVDAMRAAGVEFLDTPDSYYDDPELRARIGEVRAPIEELKQRKILVDRDEDGYLLQIFTKPVQDRPTVFFELIERHGSLGFGKGNFKALFEAIEREQELRGNL